MAAPQSYAGFSLAGTNQDGTGSITYFYRNGDREFKARVPSRGQDHSGGKSKLIEFDPYDEIIAEFNRAGIVESLLPEVSIGESAGLLPNFAAANALPVEGHVGGLTARGAGVSGGYFLNDEGEICYEGGPEEVQPETPVEVSPEEPTEATFDAPGGLGDESVPTGPTDAEQAVVKEPLTTQEDKSDKKGKGK